MGCGHRDNVAARRMRVRRRPRAWLTATPIGRTAVAMREHDDCTLLRHGGKEAEEKVLCRPGQRLESFGRESSES
jgi:hypothetical protein